MEVLLGVALAVGACCGLPLAIGGVALLLSRGKRKSGPPQAQQSHSVMDACCQVPATLVKRTVQRLRGKEKQGESTAAR